METISNARQEKTRRLERNVLKTLALVSALFVLCWVWNQVYILMHFMGVHSDFSSSFYHFTVIAVFSNCCVNPVVYASKYEDFQAGIRRMFAWASGRRHWGNRVHVGVDTSMVTEAPAAGQRTKITSTAHK